MDDPAAHKARMAAALPGTGPVRWSCDFAMPAPRVEDGGSALVADADGEERGGDGRFFVRLQSWDETWDEALTEAGNAARREATGHRLFRSLIGRRVRVTVETLD